MADQIASLFAKIGADVSGATAGLKQVRGDLDATATHAGGVGSKFAALGGLMATGIAVGGAAMAGVAVIATKTAADFEQTISGIKAVSGATADEMASVQALALKLGADTAFSAKEAAAGIEELIKGGVSIPDVLNGAAKSMLDLAAAGSVSLPVAAEIAANALAMFELKGSDMAHAADLIAGAANASSLSVTDFKFSMAAVGAVASQAGQTFDDLAQAIAVMGKSGMKGSDAGTSLKAMLLNLQPTTDKARKVFDDLGITVDGANNQFVNANGTFKSMAEISGILQTSMKHLTAAQKLQALETMFSSDGMRAAGVLAKAGASGFSEMAASMGKVTAASVGAERLNNLNGSLEQLKGSLETAAISLGTAFLPTLRLAADGATAFVNAAIPWITEQGPRFNAAVVSVSGAIGPLIERVKGAAAQFGPLADRARELIGQVSPLAESVGKHLVQAFVDLRPTGERVQAMLDAITSAVKSLIPTPLLDLVRGIGETTAKSSLLKDALGLLTGAINTVSGAIASATRFVGEHHAAQSVLVGVLGALTAAWLLAKGVALAHTIAVIAQSAATGGLTVAQGLLNAVMAANPIGIVVVALAGLTAALVYAYQTSETFRNVVDGVFRAVVRIGATAVNIVIDEINKIIEAIEFVMQLKDRLFGQTPGTIGRIGRIEVPALASGGIVTSPTLALIGERGPEAVIPLGSRGAVGAGGGGFVFNNYAPIYGYNSLEDAVVQAWQKAQRRGRLA